MKFYDVNSGSISVDGIDYGCINVKSLRSSFGMVLQDTWLKSGTIAENLAIGKPDATRDEIIAAAKKAHSHSFIKQPAKRIRYFYRRGRRQSFPRSKTAFVHNKAYACGPADAYS